MPPQVLGYQLTLFGPRGADYARHITTAPPQSFCTMRRLWDVFLYPIFCHSFEGITQAIYKVTSILHI